MINSVQNYSRVCFVFMQIILLAHTATCFIFCKILSLLLRALNFKQTHIRLLTDGIAKNI